MPDRFAEWRGVLLLIVAAGLLLLAYNGTFARFMADDYCIADDGLRHGVLGAVARNYENWSGRYTTYALSVLIGPGGTFYIALFPALLLTLWVGAGAWFFTDLAAVIGLKWPRRTGLLLAMLTVFAASVGTFSPIQSLYWIPGSASYTVPLIACFAGGALLLRVVRTGRAISAAAGVFALALIAGGTSETWAAIQIALLALATAGGVTLLRGSNQRALLIGCGAGLAGGLIALGLLLAAPGNAVRQAALADINLTGMSLTELIIPTLLTTASTLASALGVWGPTIYLALLLIGVWVGMNGRIRPAPLRSRRAWGWIGGSALVLLLLIAATIAPAFYAMGVQPSERNYIIPAFFLALTALTWGLAIGFSQRPAPRPPHPLIQAGLVALIGALLLFPIIQHAGETPRLQTYAAAWDAQDALIRAAAAESRIVTVAPLPVDLAALANLESLGPDPAHWINGCAARYYDVDQITVARDD